jgi:SAM-dependent methyltransferase
MTESERFAEGRVGQGDGERGLSPSLLAWLAAEPLADRTVLDVGTGTGRLALALAPRARRIFGIDTDASALVDARRRARRAGLTNVLFIVADAEQADYRSLARFDAVVAHLCMSDAIAGRAGAALDGNGLLAFASFHVDQWRETGRVSRFAYDPDRARTVLTDAGFRVDRMEVEREVETFGSAADALAATGPLRGRWEADGRWAAWEGFLGGGGRTLTRSRLVVLARRGDRP